MTVNERIKLLRQELNLSQAKFAKAISISNGYIAGIELGNRSVNDRIIKLISTEFNVREEWLRDGIEPKFNTSDTFSLDEFAQRRNMSDIDLKIIKAYLELDPDVRKIILSTFKNALSDDKEEVKEKVNHVIGFVESNTNYTKEDDDTKNLSTLKVAEEIGNYTTKGKSVEELEEDYKKNVLKNAPKQVVSASSGIEGDSSKVV